MHFLFFGTRSFASLRMTDKRHRDARSQPGMTGNRYGKGMTGNRYGKGMTGNRYGKGMTGNRYVKRCPVGAGHDD